VRGCDLASELVGAADDDETCLRARWIIRVGLPHRSNDLLTDAGRLQLVNAFGPDEVAVENVGDIDCPLRGGRSNAVAMRRVSSAPMS
jgi:hypothetical protein